MCFRYFLFLACFLIRSVPKPIWH